MGGVLLGTGVGVGGVTGLTGFGGCVSLVDRMDGVCLDGGGSGAVVVGAVVLDMSIAAAVVVVDAVLAVAIGGEDCGSLGLVLFLVDLLLPSCCFSFFSLVLLVLAGFSFNRSITISANATELPSESENELDPHSSANCCLCCCNSSLSFCFFLCCSSSILVVSRPSVDTATGSMRYSYSLSDESELNEAGGSVKGCEFGWVVVGVVRVVGVWVFVVVGTTGLVTVGPLML